MKVLVTGSAGFIGSHVAQVLLARGDTVIGFDSLNDYYDVTLKQARLARFIDHPNYIHVQADLANRAAVEPYKAKIADGSLALVVADTLPTQIEQLKEGFSAGQVGQRPFEMGYKVMQAFEQMAEGGAAPEDPTYTGLDICTPETADTCIAK